MAEVMVRGLLILLAAIIAFNMGRSKEEGGKFNYIKALIWLVLGLILAAIIEMIIFIMLGGAM